MCSIGDDDFGDEGGLHAMIKDEPLPEVNTNLRSCSKCDTKGTLIKLKFRDAECADCFLAYTRHKFRATLGSSKILPKAAKVLLLFDGTAESMALLDMMHYAQTQNTYKRLHVNTMILFINENSISEIINISDIQSFLSKYEFEAFAISLADNDSLCKLEQLDPCKDLSAVEKNFVQSVKNIKSLTSRQDFIKVWKNKIIETAAKQLKCDFAFAPDISTNLATELLNSISLGRGGSAALDVSLLDDRFPGLKLVRPLRTLNANEVKFYLQVNNLKEFKSASYGEELGANYSIQNLTKQFVENLQTNFSSTISTVFRTGDKIAPHNADLSLCNETTNCSFCHTHIDSTPSKTLLAIEFSRVASACGNLENCKHRTIENEKILLDGGPGELCHACANVLKDSKNINLLKQ